MAFRISRSGCSLGRSTLLGGGKSGSRQANSASVRSVRYGRRRVTYRPSYWLNRPTPQFSDTLWVAFIQVTTVELDPVTGLQPGPVVWSSVGPVGGLTMSTA